MRISDWSSDVCCSDLKSLNLISQPKGARFVQVDFSATPYNEVGTGRNSRKAYFPHIVVDFDLKTAMRAGLVKSLVLDKRSEIGALSQDRKSTRLNSSH